MDDFVRPIVSLLPDGISFGIAAILIIASFFTSATTASFGIGGGVMMLAIMGIFLPVSALIPVQGLVQLGSNSGRAFVQRRHVQMQILGPFLIGSIIGAIIGGFTVVQLPDALMKIILGCFILIITWASVPGLQSVSRFALALASAVVAFLTMFLGATGPLMAAVLAAIIPGDRRALIATSAVALVVHHGLKVLIFGILGFSFAPWMPLIIAMIATGYLGTLVGSSLLSQMPETLFRVIFKLVVSLLALDMLRRGLSNYPIV